jgi:hypothetical protein
MWLAALVLQHNLALHARDKHFDRLPQLVRVCGVPGDPLRFVLVALAGWIN